MNSRRTSRARQQNRLATVHLQTLVDFHHLLQVDWALTKTIRQQPRPGETAELCHADSQLQYVGCDPAIQSASRRHGSSEHLLQCFRIVGNYLVLPTQLQTLPT